MPFNEKISGLRDEEVKSSGPTLAGLQKLKSNLRNPLFLISFIAFSVLIIDVLVIYALLTTPQTTEKEDSSSAVSSSTNEESGTSQNNTNSSEQDESKCNVIGINMHGHLMTYIPKEDYNDSGDLKVDDVSSESIYFTVKDAQDKDNIKAIIVEIDSGGGDPTAAEELVKSFKSSSKPVIAYIRGMGASAAYWSATGASRIFALPSSQVGSIAVNSSYLDNVKYNQKNGYTFNELTSGKFKNILSNDKPLTEEERALIMKDVYATHEEFIKAVAENRKLDIGKVKEIANGWAYTGRDALKLGLIDEIGGLDEVSNYLKTNILDDQEANICW